MSIQSAIEEKLVAAFRPDSLEVVNESHLHAGHHHDTSHHAPFDGTGETHFRVRIVADAFGPMSRLERHRAVNAALAGELAGGIHALAIEARAPSEAAGR
ncbi:BolA family transcriptional regulator [Aureimonas altamirensis]|uniref:BolA family transcriptional regulator n=1 Tax=Aureimonas altamirensis TaxID=370622 RepID=A0A0B1Q8X1_9HYPH|nr:BolA family protein [Aureimonas altamirensis]KHJ55260.1 BolA family transcriptional regulator [Aureimonas altamirensis]